MFDFSRKVFKSLAHIELVLQERFRQGFLTLRRQWKSLHPQPLKGTKDHFRHVRMVAAACVFRQGNALQN